jgi:Skp family chaperone for outer membrane proteins
MKQNFNNIWKYVAGGGTILAYQTFWDRMSNKNTTSEMKDLITQVDNKVTDMGKKIDNYSNPEEKTRLLTDCAEVKSDVKNLGDIHNSFYEKSQGLSKNSEKELLFKDYNEQFKEAFTKVSDKVEDLVKSVNNMTKNFTDDNSILQIINEFKDYLASLSSTDICLVINISSSIFIFTCLVSIIFAVYGNFLIDRFSLEDKYPKLAFFMRLRVKLQHTYIISNTLFIVIALILMIIVNLITLMKL